MNYKKITNERSFSIQLKSKSYLSNIALNNGLHENVLVEGTIGELCHARFLEGIVFEIVGSKGILRVDLTQDEIKTTSANRVVTQ